MKLNMTLTIEDPPGVIATVVVTEDDFTAAQLSALDHIYRHRGETPTPPAGRTHVSAPASAPDMDRHRRDARREIARASGYVGEICNSCGSFDTKRNGSCLCCDACGATTGCS